MFTPFIKQLLSFLRYTTFTEEQVDGPERMYIHAEILAKKKMVKEVFRAFHVVGCVKKHIEITI